MTFVPNEYDSFDVHGSLNNFPNLEGYHVDPTKSKPRTLFQLRNYSEDELTSDLGYAGPAFGKMSFQYTNFVAIQEAIREDNRLYHLYPHHDGSHTFVPV